MDAKSDKDKKQILLRLSPQLWRDLASWAEDDFRSINGQIEYLLSESVRRRKKALDSEGDAGGGGKGGDDQATGG
jgi:hypothetical protein